MSDEKQQNPSPTTAKPSAEVAPAPPDEVEPRTLTVDDVEADEGDDVKGGGILFDMGTPAQ